MNLLAGNRTLRPLCTALTLLLLIGCAETPTEQSSDGETFDLMPRIVRLFPADTITFEAADSLGAVEWRVTSGPGAIDASGHYVAPASIAGDTAVATIEARSLARADDRGIARVTVVADTTQRICYDRDVRPIMRGTCASAGCHDPGVRQKGFDFTDDIIVQRATTRGEPEHSLIYHMIASDDDHHRMPPAPRAPLTPAQIATIGAWIEQGSSLRPCRAPGEEPCDPTDASWANDVRPILTAACTSCHFPGSPGGIDLESIEGARAVALSGQLFGSISHAPGYARMPSDSVRLPECDVLTIRSWIDAGAPDN